MLVWMSAGFAGPAEGAVSPSVANATQGLIAPFFMAACQPHANPKGQRGIQRNLIHPLVRTSWGQARWYAMVLRRIAYGTRLCALSFHLARRKDDNRSRTGGARHSDLAGLPSPTPPHNVAALSEPVVAELLAATLRGGGARGDS